MWDAVVASPTTTHVTTDVTAVPDIPTSTVPLASTTRTTTAPEPVSVTNNGTAKAASNGAESATRAARLYRTRDRDCLDCVGHSMGGKYG
jgi:hypothetical protein